MLPVTRANLDHICCICLLDIRSSMFAQKVYDVRKERNLPKVLKLTAHITVLKNPTNEKYLGDYCRKICEMCFVKIQYSYALREKIVASTTTLKELLENNDINEMDIEKLKYFCRICLNRQKDIKRLELANINWLKQCSGIRFTSFVDHKVFRIKEGTNINEIAVIDDKHFPQHLCRCCFKQLKNVDEFRKFATQSFEYMLSVMDDAISPESHLVCPEIINRKKLWKNVKQLGPELLNCKKDERNAEIINLDEKQDKAVTDMFPNQIFNCEIGSILNAEGFISKQLTESTTTQLKDDSTCYYSDNSEGDNNSNPLLANCSKSGINSLKQARIKSSVQIEANENITSEEETNIVTKNSKSLRNLKENKNNSETTISKNADNNGAKLAFVCEDCSKKFSSKRSLRKHIGTVHNFDSAKMIECKICLKKFKRKSHLDDHVKSVHDKLKPFKCSYCEKTFTTKSTKRVHELGHTGDFPFICNFCGKSYRRSNQLKMHLDIHTTTPELLCPICKRSQTSKADLENHLKLHSDKRVQCPLCGKFFSRNFHLVDHHNAVHLKLRPFRCQYCELAFGDRKTRRTHEKLHTEDRPLKCSICTLGFKTQVGLTKHVKEIGHIPERI